MMRFSNPLDHISIASPCHADWDQMTGNDRARFCGQCNLNVYNLSSMTREEAELLIGRTEGRLCVRYFRRADGSVLTRDCPVGLRAIRRRMSYVARAVGSAVLGFLAGLGFNQFMRPSRGFTTMGAIAIPARTLPVVQQPPSTQEPYAIIELGDLRMGRVGMGKVVGTPPPPALQKKTRSRR
jgi:hypothetical protein